MSRISKRFQARRVVQVVLASLVLTLVVVAHALSTISLGRGWSYEVSQSNLPDVSGVALSDAGTLYVTLEGRHGTGQLISISGETRALLVGSLNKPDGLSLIDGRPVFTQEFGVQSVTEWSDEGGVALFTATNAEGIDVAENGDVYVVEDVAGGRILKFDRGVGLAVVLVADLEEAEGLCVMRDGTVFYTEKAQGNIYRWRSGSAELFLGSLTKPGYVSCDQPKHGLWITEDRTNFGRLLHVTSEGDVHVISGRLKSPQSIAITPAMDVLLAEQGRNRIVRFSPKAPASLAASIYSQL